MNALRRSSLLNPDEAYTAPTVNLADAESVPPTSVLDGSPWSEEPGRYGPNVRDALRRAPGDSFTQWECCGVVVIHLQARAALAGSPAVPQAAGCTR